MGLHCNQVDDDCPFDVSRLHVRRLPRRGHRPQPGDRLGVHEPRPRRHRPLPRGGRRRALPARAEVARLRAARGDDPDRRRGAVHVHGALARSTARCSPTSARTYASVGANAPVAGRVAGPGRRLRGRARVDGAASPPAPPRRSSRSTAPPTGRSSATRPALLRRAQPEHRVRRPGRPHRLPGARAHPGPATGHTGDYPAPGWDRRYDWTGKFVPFEALPTVLDPEEGFIATANQAPVDPGYPYYLGSAWDIRLPQPADRRPADQEGHAVSVADMSEIQLDTSNGFAPVLVPYLLDVDAGTRYYSGGQRLLGDWDFTQPADSAAAAYFNAVWKNLLRLTFDDQLPTVGHQVNGGDRWFEVVRRLLEEPNRPVVGRRRHRRTCARDATTSCGRRCATPATSWCGCSRAGSTAGRWGHQHTLDAGEPDHRPVRHRAGRRPGQPRRLGAAAAAPSIVNAIGWNAAEGYEVNWVPSMRMVVSLARPRRLDVGQPDRSQRARVQRALHRPDRAVGRRARRCRGRSRRDAVEGAADEDAHAQPPEPGEPGRGRRRGHRPVVRGRRAPGRRARRRRAGCR